MDSLQTSFSCERTHGKTPEAHAWTEHLLQAVSIRSFMPGRVRFAIGFPGNETLADTLRRELQKEGMARLQSYSVRTRTALVTYDPDVADPLKVMQALLRGVLEYARQHGECALEHHHHDGHAHGGEEESCDHDHSATATDAGIRKELLKLVVTGGVLGYFVYKKVAGKQIAFPNNSFLDVAGIVTVFSGYPIFRRGVETVRKRKKPTDDTLISIAVIATLLMGESLTGLSVVWLINLGRLLEAITLKRSRTAIKELMDITPSEAWRLDTKTGRTWRDSVEKIQKGQIIRVFAGEKVPLDGKLVRGEALAKEAFITGEPMPAQKKAGMTVYAGSLLEAGEIDVEVTSLVNDTVVARIIHAIENIRDKKAPIEKVGTRFASGFVPISLGLFGVTLLFTGDLQRAITMLVIACPCAAGLATPTAVSASIGQAARRGILIKGGTHIEAAARIDTVIFDKTGTLTRGTPALVKHIETKKGKALGFEECLRLAASAEQHTTHPLGLVLVNEAKKRKITLSTIKKYEALAGLGVHAEVDGHAIDVGSRRYMRSLEVETPKSMESEVVQEAAGESVLYLAVNGSLHGIFLVQDTIRPEAAETIARLKSLGIKRVLIATGDQRVAAERIASQLGNPELHADLLPEDKLRLVRRLKSEGAKVAMVGDGVNDAQALVQADLSIALGAGRCDVAMESADVTLARNDLRLVADVFQISEKTLRTIYQNFIASVGINVGGIGFSMFGKLTPFSAAIVHNASTIAVVMNSLRLGREVAGTNPLNVLKEVKI